MFLKNYTSQVPVSQTIYRIEQVLIKCGVSGITKEYDPHGSMCALQFHLGMGEGLPAITVRLPANKEKAWDALWLDYADGERLTQDGTRLAWNQRRSKTKKDFEQQAERTAWRIMQDWVEVQMSMIQLKQAETLEVFLPYVWNQHQSFYHALKANGYKGLLPEKTS